MPKGKQKEKAYSVSGYSEDSEIVAPEVPKKRKNKKKDQKKKVTFVKVSGLESLYWRVSWLQFCVMAISFWAVVISSYEPEAAVENGFWGGFNEIKVIAAISGTITSFSNVVLGGMIKQFNRQIDYEQKEREIKEHNADSFEKELEISEKENKKKNQRILELESHLLDNGLQMQKMAEKIQKLTDQLQYLSEQQQQRDS